MIRPMVSAAMPSVPARTPRRVPCRPFPRTKMATPKRSADSDRRLGAARTAPTLRLSASATPSAISVIDQGCSWFGCLRRLGPKCEKGNLPPPCSSCRPCDGPRLPPLQDRLHDSGCERGKWEEPVAVGLGVLQPAATRTILRHTARTETNHAHDLRPSHQ